MKNLAKHVGVLEILERLPNSGYGNSRFVVRIGEVVCRTKPNTRLAIDLERYAGREVIAAVGTYRGHLTLLDVDLPCDTH